MCLGKRNNKIHLRKSSTGYLNLQSCTCLIQLAHSICILILVNLLQAVHFYQIQNGKPKLIAYVSKRLPETAKDIARTMWISNKHCKLFHTYLKGFDFDAIVDHLSLTHIIKSKAEPNYYYNKKTVGID